MIIAVPYTKTPVGEFSPQVKLSVASTNGSLVWAESYLPRIHVRVLKLLARNLTVLGCAQLLSCVLICVTPWTVAHQAPLSLWDFSGKHSEVG